MTQFRTFTDAERVALKLHGLNTSGPSQLSDAFVLGMRHAGKGIDTARARKALSLIEAIRDDACDNHLIVAQSAAAELREALHAAGVAGTLKENGNG